MRATLVWGCNHPGKRCFCPLFVTRTPPDPFELFALVPGPTRSPARPVYMRANGHFLRSLANRSCCRAFVDACSSSLPAIPVPSGLQQQSAPAAHRPPPRATRPADPGLAPAPVSHHDDDGTDPRDGVTRRVTGEKEHHQARHPVTFAGEVASDESDGGDKSKGDGDQRGPRFQINIPGVTSDPQINEGIDAAAACNAGNDAAAAAAAEAAAAAAAVSDAEALSASLPSARRRFGSAGSGGSAGGTGAGGGGTASRVPSRGASRAPSRMPSSKGVMGSGISAAHYESALGGVSSAARSRPRSAAGPHAPASRIYSSLSELDLSNNPLGLTGAKMVADVGVFLVGHFLGGGNWAG